MPLLKNRIRSCVREVTSSKPNPLGNCFTGEAAQAASPASHNKILILSLLEVIIEHHQRFLFRATPPAPSQ